MELIPYTLREDFREFCVSHRTLGAIDDVFLAADIPLGVLAPERLISGQRRYRVECYYASIDWTTHKDAQKFAKVLSLSIGRSTNSTEERTRLVGMVRTAGLVFNGKAVQLSGHTPSSQDSVVSADTMREFRDEIIEISKMPEQRRGYEFERFLNKLFDVCGLKPRQPFRLVGEQIDGSFEFQNAVYLLEAKWQQKPTPQNDLLVFREKVESKSVWSRGLFVSISAFSNNGLEAFARGRATNIIGVSGEDLFKLFEDALVLTDMLALKIRRAAETGEFYVPLRDLLQ